MYQQNNVLVFIFHEMHVHGIYIDFLELSGIITELSSVFHGVQEWLIWESMYLKETFYSIPLKQFQKNLMCNYI